MKSMTIHVTNLNPNVDENIQKIKEIEKFSGNVFSLEIKFVQTAIFGH